MATYKDPYALPNPQSIAHAGNQIFIKLIDAGNEVFHLYGKHHFFKTSKGPVFFYGVRDMYNILISSDYLPYWSKSVQHEVCRQVLQKCLKAAKPWTPLPADPRRITPCGTKPTKVDYQLYIKEIMQYGMHQTPDGTHEKLFSGKTGLPFIKVGRKPTAIALNTVPANTGKSTAISAGTVMDDPTTHGRQELIIGVALPEHECHVDPQDGSRLPTDQILVESVTEENKED